MTKLVNISLICTLLLSIGLVNANEAKSQKHANKAAHLRQSLFTLIGNDMRQLGGIAKGKLEFNAKTVEKHAQRINQLSYMIEDYTKTDTSKYNVKTDALNKVWLQRDKFTKRINELNSSSAKLVEISATNDEKAIKKAIGAVGKSCGGCHDNFKKD